CHTASMKTGSNHLFAELRDQTIRPYSDLLLHDMGPGLADDYKEGQANGHMWRTATLWGLGYTDKVLDGEGTVGYLHDGRARNLTEAIMWHDGEAAAARNRFAKLAKAQRDELMAFLRSL
ncbi:di-heme oxidoredictase family protein, partial [Massilia oculi]|uniref:di-heme oxidoredictase family protein n=1 Tax=Massilia oculi TaxID=945844 RepID=UPI0028A6925D